MATYQVQVEALTGLSFTSSSTPTLTELSTFLVSGLADVVNRTVKINPEESMKFATTTNSTTTVANTGLILSVMREHDSTSILRPCTQIPAELRYESTNTDSLYFRSKYNPGWYQLGNLIHCVPTPNDSSNNDLVVTQVFYDTGLAYGDEAPDNFPEHYNYLITLYACMESCLSRISYIEANLPDEPILSTDMSDIDTQIDNDDPEMAGVAKDKVTQQITEHNSRVAEYQAEIQKRQLEIKILSDKYMAFTNQYNASFGLSMSQSKDEGEEE